MSSAMSKLSMDTVRTALKSRRAELAQRLERVSRDARHQGAPVSADFAEQANETSNDEVLDAIGDTVRAEIADIDTALERVAAGGYGQCTRCGAAISAERLQVVPYALTCSACASRG